MNIVALAGGVGGAKLVDGLARSLPEKNLVVIVNTGDDFDHFSLKICPDLDTVCYTLAGIANPETGWGRMAESWSTMDSIAELGGPTWFRLGDRDLGTHLERTRLLAAGKRLSEITSRFCQAWGVAHVVLPMSDDPAPTRVLTEDGELDFQDYFVKRQCEPFTLGFRYGGSDQAQPAPGILEALRAADVIVICPSNPWVSVDPILAVKGIRPELVRKPVLAVSPIVGGQALKGPAAKMYLELGVQPSALAVAEHYQALLNGFVLDTVDEVLAPAISRKGILNLVCNTVMNSIEEREALAARVLRFAERILSS
jgi:LPPG:FO 2-phospho-L-lactate transferase